MEWQPGEPCPFCGDPVVPNRERRSEKSPSYKCVNKDCQGQNGRPFASWHGLPKRTGSGTTAPARQGGHTPAQPYSGSPSGSWSVLAARYDRCVKIAMDTYSRLATPKQLGDQALVAAVATLFIQANKDNLSVAPPAAARQPSPPPSQQRVAAGPGAPGEFDDFPPPHDDPDSDMPF